MKLDAKELLLNRNQAIRVLKLTGRQFDYVCNKFDIIPQKVGNVSIYTVKQIFKARVCFEFYRELKFTDEIIKNFLNILKDFNEKEFNKMIITSPEMIGMDKKDKQKILKDTKLFTAKNIIQDTKNKTEYWIIDWDDYQAISRYIVEFFKEINYISMIVIYNSILQELKAGLKKENLYLTQAC